MADGPFKSFYAAATHNHGLFGQLGLKHERELTDKLISQVQSNQDLDGLSSLAELGRSPMTREQHVSYRNQLSQQALNQETAGTVLTAFDAQQGRLRQSAVGKYDNEHLDVMDSQASQIRAMLKSADPSFHSLGAQQLGSLLESQRAYSQQNEATQIQLDAAEATDRNEKRKEFQTNLDARITDPLIKDSATYASIRQQLATGKGDELVPASLVTAGLEYAGSVLRQSDDGSWSFGIAGVGFRGTDLAPMTYSQLRNRVDAAHQGRATALQNAGKNFLAQGKAEGFGVNGTEVSDLVFPLADQVYKEREAETKPPTIIDPKKVQDITQDVSSSAGQLYDKARDVTSKSFDLVDTAREYLRNPVPAANMTATREPDRTSVRGVIQRPTNEPTP